MSSLAELADLLRSIRDRLTEGAVRPGRQKTQYDGVELPLVLATITSDPKDIRKFGLNFMEAWKQDSHHYTRGLVLVQVDSVNPAGVLVFCAEIQVVGYISGVPDILSTAFVNSLSGPLSVTVAHPYDYLRVAARQMVNGVPDNTTASPLLTAQVTVRVER